VARGARERSSTGIYHVMVRGIDKRNLFIEDVDRIKFIESIKKAKYKVVKRYNDNTLREIINKEYDIKELGSIPIEKRNKIIKEIYSNKDTSIRQLSRVLGIGKTIIEKAIKGDR